MKPPCCTHAYSAQMLLFFSMYLSLVRFSPHPVSIHQGHVLARVVETWWLVSLHQLTPAKHVAQVELPGTSSLAPAPLHTHLLHQLMDDVTSDSAAQGRYWCNDEQNTVKTQTLLLNSTILLMISLSIWGKMESPMNSMSLLVSGSTKTCGLRSSKKKANKTLNISRWK